MRTLAQPPLPFGTWTSITPRRTSPPGGGPGQIEVTTTEGGSPEADEVQHIGAILATAGTYTLSFEGETTPNLPFDAGAPAAQSALEALPAIGAGNVSVSGSQKFSNPLSAFSITFKGALAATNVPQIVASDGSPRLSIAPELWFDIANVGGVATSGPITLTITLPKGLSRQSIQEERLPQVGSKVKWKCPGAAGDTKVVCTTSEAIARHTVNTGLRLAVNVANDAADPRTVAAKLEGGGAPNVATALERIHIDSAPAGFGVLPESFQSGLFESDESTPVSQSGAHPALFTTPFDFTTIANPNAGVKLSKNASGSVRDLHVDLPPGFVGNPNAVGECTQAQFTLIVCPPSSQVGRIDLRLNALPALADFNADWVELHLGVFNLSHPRGTVADLGFAVGSIPVHIRASLDPANNYAITTTVPNINETLPPMTQKLTVWGVPADPSHDAERCAAFSLPLITLENGDTSEECATDHPRVPFLTAPFRCGVANKARLHHYDSWEAPGVYGPEIETALPETTGCEKPRFEPDVEIVPTGKQANTPTGLDVHIKIPQNESADGLATPPVKSTVVTLPEGMTVNPAFADGLVGCSEAQIGLETNDPVACPDNSRIGEVSLDTPLLPKPIEGSMYLAKQGDNPFHSLLAVYLAVHDTEERGALVKVPGKISLDPNSGQITTSFDDLPQFPFEELTLKFRSGNRAPLVNPPTCGRHEIAATMTSYARPGEQVDASNTYAVSEGPGGAPCQNVASQRPFDPQLTGGSVNPVAGAFSPLELRVSRTDADQELSAVEGIAPPGLIASLRGVGRCSEAQIAAAVARNQPGQGAQEIASPSCPADSQVGTVDAGAGAGPTPIYVPGKIYLAGPYKGAPLSGVAIVPALAGPVDLGVVVVRAPAYVDPRTARIRIASDPLPQIVNGVLIRTRDVRIHLDRPDFTLNPTSCEPMAIAANLLSTEGALKSASNRFQVGDCASLGFKPRLGLKLTGGAKRGGHPALRGVFRPRPGDANLSELVLRLPRSAFLDQAHIRTICTRVQFAAEACPPGAVYGQARAFTPLLEEPLEGPVYLRSSDNNLPDFVADLHGTIDVEAVARIDSAKGGIRATFTEVPDAPLSKVVVAMQGAKKGLIVNSMDLCAGKNRANARFTGQNGKQLRLRPLMRNGCTKTPEGKRHSGRAQKRRG